MNEPTKILFDANPLIQNKSGIGYYVDGLIGALSKAGGSEIELVGHYFNFLGKKKLTDMPQAANIRYISTSLVPTKALSLGLKLGIQLPHEAFTRTRADIYLATNYVAPPSLFKGKKIAVVYDTGFIDCPEFISARNLQYLKKWVPKSVRNADLTVTISEFVKQRLMAEFKLSSGVVHVTSIPPVLKKTAMQAKLDRFNIPGKFLLFVGTLEPRKNLVTLLDGYEKLPEQLRAEYSLVLAGGKGWNDHEIINKLQKMQSAGLNVITTGYVSDDEKAKLYAQATLCIQPSFYEGFGMPILEAMKYEKAVLCSDIPVFHEVADNAVAYFETHSPNSLSMAIKALLSEEGMLQKYSRAGKVRLQSMPNWDDVAKEFIEKLKEMKFL